MSLLVCWMAADRASFSQEPAGIARISDVAQGQSPPAVDPSSSLEREGDDPPTEQRASAYDTTAVGPAMAQEPGFPDKRFVRIPDFVGQFDGLPSDSAGDQKREMSVAQQPAGDADEPGEQPPADAQPPDDAQNGQADEPIIEQPTTTAQAPPAPPTTLLGELNFLAPTITSSEVVGESRQSAAAAPASNVISGVEAASRATTDAGNLLRQSHRDVGVYVVQRSPIIGDPRIRGYRFGQYLASADGGFWFPARLDVDSILSKIDSHIIEDIVVIKGPYSARYGPAFSFIDVATVAPPRHEHGFQADATTGLNFNSNGEQWYARETVRAGAADYGFLVHYSHLTGVNYEAGPGFDVPASYKSRNVNAALGLDLTDNAILTLRYLRQDQTDVELAGQFTDIDVLVSNAFNLNLTVTDQPLFDRLSVDAWHNHSEAKGSSQRSSKQQMLSRIFPPPQGTLGFTNYDVGSSGYTLAMSWGDADDAQLTLGSDLRYYERSLDETQVRIGPLSHPFLGTIPGFTALAPIPESHSSNPGLFAELSVAPNDRLRVRTGGRVDWVSTDASSETATRILPIGSLPLDVLGPNRGRNFFLGSGFVTGEYGINDAWTANIGVGYAERPPTLEELYAERPFESILQQGLNRIQGFPLLDESRLVQVDVGVQARYESFQGFVRGFHAWVNDYITSQTIAIDPTSASMDRVTTVFVNTDLVTLAGAELLGELDVTDNISLFGNMMYVEGRNQTLNSFLFTAATAPPGSAQGAFFGRGAVKQTPGEEPLPQIPPLEARLGVRLHPAGSNPNWGIEFLARVVDSQDRIANLSLLEQPTAGFTTYDVRGFYRPHESVTLIAGVLNLTDKHYREHLDSRAGDQLFQPGFSAYIGGQVDY